MSSKHQDQNHPRRERHRILPAACCLLPAVILLLAAHCSLLTVHAQTVADKMVASVTNGARATPDLISYSDLVWQLALEPGRPMADRPASVDLNHALRLLEDQLLILQEARKLPAADTDQARKEFDDAVVQKLKELTQAFGSRTSLEERMKRVGLTSQQLNAILRDRVTVEKYLDFRFRAFVLISPKEITDRYNQEYTRQRNSGRIVPTLEQVRSRIEQQLTEEKIASEIDTFVDGLREQSGTEIVIISPV
ncbi:MAG TPA: hypothetical protein VN956_08245 [Pyrinomonadaceae bacterium]|nr:hypothetical protein [Pyrinomonadaceae bacterium]